MFELFPDQPVYEYSQMINILYSFVWAFILSAIIAITHRRTFTGDHYPKNFFQSLILGAIVTTMVMMAIGDSLARGLGVFGAMAIIRFRTRVDDPRDVLFLFAALSTGLAIGVYGFTISFAGTMLFCLTAVILHFTSFRSFVYNNAVSFALQDVGQLPTVVEAIGKYATHYKVNSMGMAKEGTTRYQYAVILTNDAAKSSLLTALRDIEGISKVEIMIIELTSS